MWQNVYLIICRELQHTVYHVSYVQKSEQYFLCRLCNLRNVDFVAFVFVNNFQVVLQVFINVEPSENVTHQG